MTATQTRHSPPTPDSRSADGRFAKGNPGGPGNPFYRKQAEFRRAALELFTPVDVMSLLRVMLALGRNGDVAAAKVFLEYVVGKPHKAPDPDREEHHEWQLFAEAPRRADATERFANGVPADPANDATRNAVPNPVAARPEGVFDARNGVPPIDDCPCHPPETPPAEVAEENGSSEADSAEPTPAQRSRATLRLLTANLHAAVANGDNGEARERYQRLLARLTGDNGSCRTVPTGDNSYGPTVTTADNGHNTYHPPCAASRSGPNGTPGHSNE